MSKSARTPATKKGSDKETCDLCAGLFKASEEVLQCEGSCHLYMHRYCAGLARHHYMKLKSASKPFVCFVCTQQLHKAEVMISRPKLLPSRTNLENFVAWHLPWRQLHPTANPLLNLNTTTTNSVRSRRTSTN